MKTDNRQHIYFIIAFAILLLGLSNGLRFVLPYEVINPYEYFHGSERISFQILNIFLSGAALTLISISAGYLLATFKSEPVVNIGATLLGILLISMISVVFFFGFDVLPGVIIMLMIAMIFIRADGRVVLASFISLFGLHLIINGLLTIWSGLTSPGDTIYASIQAVNNFSSVYGGSDYFEIIGTNIEVFLDHRLGEGFMWILTILPWALLGIVLHEFDIRELFKKNRVLMSTVTALLLLGGIAIKMMEVISLGSASASKFATEFGGPLLGAGYFMLLILTSGLLPEKVRMIFSRLGKKGLSAYIAFNFVMMILAYGIGFALYGEISIGVMVFIVMIIHIVLLVLANVLVHHNVKTLEELSVIKIRNKTIK